MENNDPQASVFKFYRNRDIQKALLLNLLNGWLSNVAFYDDEKPDKG